MKLLFVCSGNICRSPMAEAMASAAANRLGAHAEVRSAGTLGIVDRPADPKAVRVCREVGLDLTDHRSQGIDDGLAAWADRLYVMEYAHAAYIHAHHPTASNRVLLLGTFAGVPEIPDPVGRWIWTFRRVRDQLQRAVDGAMQHALATLD